jgi:hypothetical protein
VKTHLIVQGTGTAAISATAGVLAVLKGPMYLLIGGMVLFAWLCGNLAYGGDTYLHERVVLVLLACVMLTGAAWLLLGIKPW